MARKWYGEDGVEEVVYEDQYCEEKCVVRENKMVEKENGEEY